MHERSRRIDAMQQAVPRLAGDVARRAFDVAATITRVTSLGELDDAMRPCLLSLGFENFVAVETRGRTTQLLVGQPHKTWYPRLIERGYQFVDAPYIAARAGASAVFYSDIAKIPDLSRAQILVSAERREFGLLDGFANSTHAPDGSILTVAMTGAEIEAHDPDVRAAAHILSTYYAIAAKRLSAPTPNIMRQVALTKRQLDCLRWVREGKSATDIGNILGISAYTVHEHVAQACARLDVRTRVQAVAAAIALRLIDP